MPCAQISSLLLILLTKSLKIKFTYRKNGKWPNTYTFSKALAEEIIQKLNGRLPIAIFRPSMGERERKREREICFSITPKSPPNLLRHTTNIDCFKITR